MALDIVTAILGKYINETFYLRLEFVACVAPLWQWEEYTDAVNALWEEWLIRIDANGLTLYNTKLPVS